MRRAPGSRGPFVFSLLPDVVLTEYDLADLSPLNRRLLFVGLTRARMHLEWVMSAGMAAMLEELVQECTGRGDHP